VLTRTAGAPTTTNPGSKRGDPHEKQSELGKWSALSTSTVTVFLVRLLSAGPGISRIYGRDHEKKAQKYLNRKLREVHAD
jgi:hypothetical protein